MNNPTGTFQEYKGLGAESQLDTLIGKGNKNATEKTKRLFEMHLRKVF